jgi:predicted transcriptional regulator of viral defense system
MGIIKKNSLYSLRDFAISAGKAVITPAEIANILGKPKNVGFVYAARLVNKSLAKRLVRGKLALIDDDFAIASQLISPSYVSLDSALLFHGIIQQVTKDIECVTTVNSLKLKKLGIVYHKIPPSLFYGYNRVERGQSYAFVAEPEKALIDGIYLGIYENEKLVEYLGKTSKKRLLELAGMYKGYGSLHIIKVVESLTKTH